MQSRLLAYFLITKETFKGTLISRLVENDYCPLKVLLNQPHEKHVSSDDIENGLVDSLNYLLHHDNYCKPWSDEHLLVRLITSPFT